MKFLRYIPVFLLTGCYPYIWPNGQPIESGDDGRGEGAVSDEEPEQEPPEPEDPGGTDDTGGQASIDTRPVVLTYWTGSMPDAILTVEIDSDPLDRDDWMLGMAETQAGSSGWYGEDCYLGMTAPDDVYYNYCHPFSGSQMQLRQTSSAAEVIEGSTTLMRPDILPTYLLVAPDGECYVWGHDISYFDGYDDCQELNNP